jgi:predicted nuclease of predicted toxin-antitoxin system
MMATPILRFLADESCDFAIVRALREDGFDVLAVSEVTSRSDDREVIAGAAQEHRILLTEDKDFGWLVFVSQVDSAGVILIRFPGNSRAALARTVRQVIDEHGEALRGAFAVVQPGHIRISNRPGSR